MKVRSGYRNEKEWMKGEEESEKKINGKSDKGG